MADCSIYFYDPSLPATILFDVLYAIPTAYILYRVIRARTWYFIVVVIGGLFEVGGYGLRSASVENVCDVAMYATSQSLIVLAPLLVAAANYMLLGRLILAVLSPENSVILGLRPTVITKVFVGFDILSFLIQASGSGIASSNSWEGNTKDIGVNVLIAGLASQLVTVVVFMYLLWIFAQRAYFGPHAREGAPHNWQNAFKADVISTTLITIRSIYRLIEFALGIEGYPFSNEWTFYVFEAVPMLFGIAIFCLWFPPAYLPKKKFGEHRTEDKHDANVSKA